MVILLSVVFFLSCEIDKDRTFIRYESLSEVPYGFPEIPYPEDNKFTPERWELGKRLFYEPALSLDSSISCATCHKQHLSFADDRALTPGVEGRPGVRNAPSLANIGYHPYFLREGSVPTLEMQVLVPIQEQNEFAHDMLSLVERLRTDLSYLKMAKAAYDRELDPFVVTRALATFQRTLISGNSIFDKYLSGEAPELMSPEQLHGMQLFFSDRTNCSKCHSGFNLTNYAFENNGLYQEYADQGRMRLTGADADEALFKVPSLRNVALTAPYMHDGSIRSLAEVIEHYNSGGKNHVNKSELIKPLRLTPEEKTSLEAFLQSLTDVEFVTNPVFRE